MKRKRYLWGAAGMLILATMLAAFCVGAYMEPQSSPGYTFFRMRYDSTSDKRSLLKWYNNVLINYNGGYIPEQADWFLCTQLQNPTPSTEFEAIVDFYVFKAGGREGRFIFLLPGEVKQRISGSVLNRIENYTPSEASRALILIESLRRGEDLGKAHFNSPQPSPDCEAWWQQYGLPEAKTRFARWWQAYPTWQEKTKHDPLAASTLEISGP